MYVWSAPTDRKQKKEKRKRRKRGRAFFILRSATISKCKQTYFWHLVFILYFSGYFVIIKEKKKRECVLI